VGVENDPDFTFDFLQQITLGPNNPATDDGVSGFGGGTTGGEMSFGLEVTYDPGDDRLYVGARDIAGTDMLPLNAGASPPTFQQQFPSGFSGPRGIAVMAGSSPPVVPPLAVHHVTPVVGSSAGGDIIEIRGEGFIAGSSVVQFLDVSVPIDALVTTVIDQNTILATVPPLFGGLQDVLVRNSDGTTDSLVDIFQPLGSVPPSPPFAVTLPAAGGGYALRSFPQYARVGDRMAAVAYQLGPYNPFLYRIFVWNGIKYVEGNQLNPNGLLDFAGRGFWVITRFGNFLTLSAPDVAQNTSNGLRVVSLVPGWNIVSQPLVFAFQNNTFNYDQVQVTSNNDLTNRVAATTSLLVSPLPYTYLNNQYFNTDQMTVGLAYWVYNFHTGPVYMVFDLSQFSKPGGPRTPGVITSLPPGAPLPPAPPGTALLDSGSGSSSGGGCGMLGAEFLLLWLARRRRRPAA
jgi:hypothetical protein